MKPFVFVLAASMLVVGLPSVRAQSSPEARTSPRLAAAVERSGDQILLVLSNPSETRPFQGVASVNFDASTEAAIRLPFTLAAGETRRLQLPRPAPSSNQYTLMVYDQAGKLVLYRVASLATATEAKNQTEQPAQSTGQVKVTARLPRKLSNSEAELSSPDEVELTLLTFVIESAIPIKDASFTLSGKNFERRQPVTTRSRTELEFKLPVELSERTFSYTLTGGNGGLLARGEIDLDKLARTDAVSVGELTFDRAVYAPGEAARAVIELQGDATRGYRLEVAVKEGETSLFKDTRKGVTLAGKSRQEFLFDLPRESKGPITLAYQVFGGQTGLLFDAGLREIALNEAPPAKTGEGKRLAP